MSKSSKRIIITGGEGMVASQVHFGIKLGKKQLDILKPASIQKAIHKYKPDVILHLAAMTDMLACEKNPKKAYNINVLGTKNIAEACKKNHIQLAYLSTCAVFPGTKKNPYTESDKPRPLNVYGKTKWQGEMAAQKVSPDTLIVRTGWLFGGGKKHDKKFAFNSFKNLQAGNQIKAVANRYGSPTYIEDLLKTTASLIKKDVHGLYHVVNKGIASYFEITKELKKIGKFKAEIIPVHASEIENPKLKRGGMEALTSSKIMLRSWKPALREYIETLKNR